MKRKCLLVAALVLAALGAWFVARLYQHRRHVGAEGSQHAKYYCPMHPAYVSDKPGDCPICNMKLVPMEEPVRGSSAPSSLSGKRVCLLHDCKMAGCPMELPMKPGEKISCPVCGVHVAGAAELSAKGRVLYYRHPMRPEVTSRVPKADEMGMEYVPVYAEEGTADVPVEGQAATTISPERRQLIGMKSEPLRRRELDFTVRASGRVAYDPDLYNAIAEYREAVKAREKVQDSSWPDVLERSEALVRASVLRLRQLGLSESQIAEASSPGGEQTSLLVGGAGGVWVYAQIYEYEIGLVKPGQAVELTTPAYPGRRFRGVVKAVDPILSAETRSLKVRIAAPNPDGALKLEMYVNAAIRVGLGRRLALPEEALLDTGTRKLAFVDLGDGRISPRELELGREADGYYEVLSGAGEGEKVVTSANFLIDSESRLKAAVSAARKKGKDAGAAPEPPSGPHRH